MMPAIEQRTVGTTGVRISSLGVGTASLGDVFGEVDDGAAEAVVAACALSAITYLDTAPLYGNGLAETRLGAALDDNRGGFTLSTKVGRTLDPDAPEGRVYDLSRDAILRGLESSLRRLDRDRVDIVYVHDPDDHEAEVYATAWPTLRELRDQGVIGAIGFGMNQWQAPLRFIGDLDVDIVMLAGRYTLLDTSAAEEFLPACLEKNVSVVAAGVFNSGVLANPVPGAWYDYAPASTEQLHRAQAIQAVGSEYGISLATLALHFAYSHPAVTSVVVGAGSQRTVARNVEALSTTVPDEVWVRLRDEGLVA